MKKVLLFTALLAVSLSSVAQKRTATSVSSSSASTSSYTSTSEFKPTEGTITTEVGVSGGINNTNFGLSDIGAKFRYFFKDDIAFRLGLSLGSSKDESTNVVPVNTPSTTIVERTTNRTFSIGAEKHFTGADRLSTFVGADILFGFNGASRKSDTSNGTFNYIEGATSGGAANRAGSFFGLRITTGADYYFTKKLYLGVEVGLGYVAGTTDEVKGSVKSTPSGAVTDSVLYSEGKNSSTSTNVVGGLKLGFQF